MTAPALCVVCGRPTPDGYACPTETGKAAAQLRDIIDMTPTARLVAAGLVRRGGAGGSSGKPGSRSPLNDGATDTLDEIQTAMTTVARDIAETRGLQIASAGQAPGDPLATACSWLLGQMEWLRHAVDDQGDPYAPATLAEIAHNAARMRGLINGPSEQRYLGPCGATLVEDITTIGTDGSEGIRTYRESECTGDVYAIRGAERGRCRTCGATVATDDRVAWLDSVVREHAFTDVWIADALRVPVKTIRSWATDRAEVRNGGGKLVRSASPAKLRAHTHDRDGRALYLLGDVADLAAADAARREERRSHRTRQETAA